MPLNLFKPKTEEQIKKYRQKWLDEAIVKSAKLKKFISDSKTGWQEVIALIDEYIAACKKRKVATDLTTANEEVLFQLKLLDRDINILEWVKRIPEQFIGRVNAELEKDKNNGD